MLASDRDDEDIESKPGVTLITLHASKGLEFPRVYLVGLEEGVLPHSRSLGDGTKDEERRLLYVGITRARDALNMTYCATRKKWGQTVSCQPSSFLGELDDEFLLFTTHEEIMATPPSSEEMSDLFADFDRILDAI